MVKQKIEEKLYSEVFCYKDIPEPYSGDGDETYWEQWIEHFEKRASQRKLDDRRKLQWLLARLVRGAQETVSKLSSNERQSFALVTKALKKQVYATCLEKRGKKSSEEIGDYAKLLLRLAKCAYPDAPEQEREGKVLSYLKPYLHSSIQSRKWKTVEEAIIVNSAVITVDEQFTNDRSEGWDKWLKEFENKCKGSCLDQSKYLLWFESRLGGRAVECYNTLSEQSRQNYEVAKSSFEAKLYQNSFEDKCKIKPTKGCVKDWALKLSELIVRAYPDIAQCNRDKEVIKIILFATETNFNLIPETVKEAVNFVCAIEWIPNEFTGSNDWCGWFSKVESYLSHPSSNMTDHEKVRCIQTRMSGNALEIFQTLAQHEKSSYKSAIECFQNKLFHHWLQYRKRGKTGWESYTKDLCSLGERVYPKEKSKQMVLEHILTLVHEPPKSKRWTSLDEAVNALMAEEVLPLFSNAEEDNWKVWKPRFQREITKHSLDNEKKLAWLSSRLGGDAKQAFDELHCTDYDTALNTLEKKLYMRRFESRTKKPSETWEQLHKHLRSLAADCYSSASDIECAVFKQICSIMKRNGIDLCVDPLSAEDAVLIVSAQVSVPNTFSGTENWETWIKDINKALSLHKISDDTKRKRFLEVRLTDTALRSFNTIHSTSKTYQEVQKVLETEVYKEKFMHRSKLPGETWKQFVDDLRNLGMHVYENKELNENIKNKILCDKNVSTAVRAENPQNVQDAASIAQAKDTIKETFSGDVDQWDNWVRLFESKTALFRLNDYEMFLWFSVSLTGDARSLCDRINCDSYANCKQALEEEIFTMAFASKKRDTYETVDQLVSALWRYAQKAFPREDTERCVLKRFKEIMQNRELEYDKLPMSTLQEAVTTFTALEEMNYNQYKEGEDWELWLLSFENAVKRNQLDDCDKVQWLKACVTGKPLEALQICPSDSSFESVRRQISIQLEKAKEKVRLSLVSCTKCSGKGNGPTCHTIMVYPSETKSGLLKFVWKIKEFFKSTDKVCWNCEKGFGTHGCTQIGTEFQDGSVVKHDCT
eukprot:Em0007g85a